MLNEYNEEVCEYIVRHVNASEDLKVFHALKTV